MSETVNIANRLRDAARRLPCKRAVVMPCGRDGAGRVTYAHLTFAQLDRESDAYARGLARIGIGRGVKTLLMVKPGLEFFALTWALFKAGAVPVLIDPGMGVSRLLHCIRAAAPEALVGIPLAQALRTLRPGFFGSVRHAVTVGRRWFWGGPTHREIFDPRPEALDPAPTAADELAAVLFTTGSTGPAKGVEYTHGIFDTQCAMIQRVYGIGEEDVDLPTFPLFALFSVGLGMTAVIPDMDPTRPAGVDPNKIVEAIHNQGCTFSFGSPALWRRVTAHCVEHRIPLPSLRKVLMAGAPIPWQVHEALLSGILSDGAETHTPFGCTESLPVADMTGSEIVRETAALTRQGKGVCVGRPVEGVEARIIGIQDGPIETWDNSLCLPDGEIGEIVVKGPMVTPAYHLLPEATAAAKIRDGDALRHRMGDVGYFDDSGRLWYCGRKAHRVEVGGKTLYSVCCEAFFNQHPRVARSALVGIGQRPHQIPVIMIEPEEPLRGREAMEAFRKEMLELAQAHPMTRPIGEVQFHPSFPVDIRHNAKIRREELAAVAERQHGS